METVTENFNQALEQWDVIYDNHKISSHKDKDEATKIASLLCGELSGNVVVSESQEEKSSYYLH